MSLFYSPGRNGFFDDAIGKPPDDAVPVTVEEHAALLDAQGTGKRIQPGPDGRPVAEDPPVVPVDLRAYAAAARYARETGGIKVGNAPVATDRGSQALITGMWAASQIDPNISVQFKSAGGGFVTLVAGQIQAIASAVAAHVQACFAAEARVDGDISAGKVTTTDQVDAAFAGVDPS